MIRAHDDRPYFDGLPEPIQAFASALVDYVATSFRAVVLGDVTDTELEASAQRLDTTTTELRTKVDDR